MAGTAVVLLASTNSAVAGPGEEDVLPAAVSASGTARTAIEPTPVDHWAAFRAAKVLVNADLPKPVLHHPGVIALDLAFDGTTVQIPPSIGDSGVARHPAAQPRHAEAGLPAFEGGVVQRGDGGVDEHGARNRGLTRTGIGVVAAEHHYST